jgi:hypothetical protein
MPATPGEDQRATVEAGKAEIGSYCASLLEDPLLNQIKTKVHVAPGPTPFAIRTSNEKASPAETRYRLACRQNERVQCAGG